VDVSGGQLIFRQFRVVEEKDEGNFAKSSDRAVTPPADKAIATTSKAPSKMGLINSFSNN